MINIISNLNKYEYDIHSLTKSFYPEHEVKFTEIEKTGPYRLEYIIDGSSIFTAEVDITDKNSMKRILYDAMSRNTGKTLPWGTLTGTRPTKMAMEHINAGMKDDDILAFMKQAYYISDEKGILSINIAELEKKILAQISPENGYSMYIDIPFCPTTCMYCSFTSNPIGKFAGMVPAYLDALEKEICATFELMSEKKPDTLYIGGGTPTTLEPDQLERLFDILASKTDLSELKEFTVEAGRADSITREKLAVMKKYGVSRISVNPQTMKDETLRLIGRHHTVGQVYDAFRMARDCGFDNINMDIILGLPGEDDADVSNTVNEIKKLGPESLTVHSLAVKRASKLNRWIEENGISAMHNTDETMRIAERGALDCGMLPYYLYRQKNMSGNFENTGYAKPGRYGIYNILIMEEVQSIAALGAGSITKRVYPDGRRIERCDNVKDVALYIEKIDEMIEKKRKFFTD